MKKNGFTLIELLAVVVILAIVAVITVPKVSDMIKESRKGAAKDSFYEILKAAELGYVNTLAKKNNSISGSTCNVGGQSIICTNSVNIKYNGKAPTSGIIEISESGSAEGFNLEYNGYVCSGNSSTKDPCEEKEDTDEDVKTISDIVSDRLASDGDDGLYVDTNNSGHYIFKGANPNNYITFNNESWRIISVEIGGYVKIIKEEKINASLSFDTKGSNKWNDSSLKTYLNNTYYSSIRTKDKKQIEEHGFNTGKIIETDTLQSALTSDASSSVKSYVGLASISDWYSATKNASCKPADNGWYSESMGANQSKYKCSTQNYLFKDYRWSLINPYNTSSDKIGIVLMNGGLSTTPATDDSSAIMPVVYLKSTTTFTGNGEKSTPYKIS